MFVRMTQYLKDISFSELVCKGNSLQNLKKNILRVTSLF